MGEEWEQRSSSSRGVENVERRGREGGGNTRHVAGNSRPRRERGGEVEGKRRVCSGLVQVRQVGAFGNLLYMVR